MRKLTRNGLLLAAPLAAAFLAHIHLRKSSPLYNFFLSPDDLYSNVAESDFDLSTEGIESTLQFTPKYPGNHVLAILVEHPLKPPAQYRSDFQVRIEINGAERRLLESLAIESSSWFYSGESYGGFALALYKVPSDLPLGQTVTINATVTNASHDFTASYGKQRIVMSKWSDE